MTNSGGHTSLRKYMSEETLASWEAFFLGLTLTDISGSSLYLFKLTFLNNYPIHLLELLTLRKLHLNDRQAGSSFHSHTGVYCKVNPNLP